MTTYTGISYDTETYAEIGTDIPGHGYGIMCDNEDIYCDSEDYYCDGSTVFRNTLAFEPEILCNDTIILCNDRWSVNCDGSEVYIKESSDV